jgi:beta-alanine degradation protein BauB
MNAALAVLLAALAQTPRQYDAALFENEYLRAHLVTLNLVGHYRTVADTPQIVYCLGTFSVSRDSGARRRCAKDQVLFVDRGDQIELRADVEPRPDLLVVELKQPVTGQYVLLQEDATNAAPEVYRLLFENRLLRVLRMTLGPGQKTRMHWHPGGDFLFPLTTATTRAILPDGGSSTISLQARVPRWTAAATRHVLENSGPTEAVALLVELK